jgi:hypothetical protein
MLTINLNLPTLPTQDQKDAMDNANAPDGTNVFITANDLTIPTLQEVTDSGNTTTNDIQFDSGAGVLLENGSRLREGTIDAGFGGTKGIAQICAVGYELKWEAGRQYVMDGNGVLIRHSLHNFTTVPSANDDATKGYYVGSLWTLDNGVSYICTDSTSTAATWDIYQDYSLLVPYTGATADVELGAYDLYANKVWLLDAPNNAYGSIHLTDNDFHIEDSDGHKMLVIEDGFMQIHKTDTIQSNLYTSGLTDIRDHYLPDASGTIALDNDARFTDARKRKVAVQSNTDASTSATTAETVLKTLLVPTLGANSTLKIMAQCGKVGTGSNAVFKMYYNTTADLSGSPVQIALSNFIAASLFAPFNRDITNKNSVTANSIFPATASSATEALSSTARTDINVNLSGKYIVITGKAGVVGDSVRVDNARLLIEE